MSKIGIYQIGFKEQNEESDIWVQQEAQQERSLPNIYLDGTRRFKSIDQKKTDLTEELVMDASGKKYKVQLPFIVRKDIDIELAKKYAGRPMVVYVWAVDGKVYKIGTKSYPAYIITSNRYQGLDTREIALTVEYESRKPLLQ